MDISKRIKQIRDFHGLSQEQFGKRLGLGRSHISLLENGKRGASERTLNDISNKYGVSRQWLLEGIGDMRSADFDFIEAVVQSMGQISDEDREIISLYLRLPLEKRKTFRQFLKQFGEG